MTASHAMRRAHSTDVGHPSGMCHTRLGVVLDPDRNVTPCAAGGPSEPGQMPVFMGFLTPPDGTACAAFWGLLVLMSSSLSACLVPLDTDVDVPVCVPSIESPPTSPTPLGTITRIVKANAGSEQMFEVDIRDCNTQQTLDSQWRFSLPQQTPAQGKEIPPFQREPFTFTVPLSEFVSGRCNAVQLFVTGSVGVVPFMPRIPGDSATVTWFFEVVDNESDVVMLGDCQQESTQ